MGLQKVDVQNSQNSSWGKGGNVDPPIKTTQNKTKYIVFWEFGVFHVEKKNDEQNYLSHTHQIKFVLHKCVYIHELNLFMYEPFVPYFQRGKFNPSLTGEFVGLRAFQYLTGVGDPQPRRGGALPPGK